MPRKKPANNKRQSNVTLTQSEKEKFRPRITLPFLVSQSTVNKNVNHALIKRLNLGGDDGHMRNLAIRANNLMLPMDSAKHSTEEDLAHSQPAIFVVDQSVMLAILEEPLGNVQEPQSTVTLMIRNPSGKSASSIKLRPLPRHKSGNVPSQLTTGRLLPVTEPPARPEYQPRFFPEKINWIPLCAADQSVPAVESVAGDERAAMELHKLSRLMEQQMAAEEESFVALAFLSNWPSCRAGRVACWSSSTWCTRRSWLRLASRPPCTPSGAFGGFSPICT